MKHYDCLIVGAGLFGATLARELRERDKTVLVIDKNPFVGGLCHTSKVHGIVVHDYGAHIFRTNNKQVWQYVNKFADFRPYVHTPKAFSDGKVYSLPFNMNTFNELWGTITPRAAKAMIESQLISCTNPTNLEEFALSVIGVELYEKFIKDYNLKQWGCACSKLPVSTMSRIPIRFTYDNNYYKDKLYQGIPYRGYTNLIENMLYDCDVLLSVDGKQFIYDNQNVANQIYYTGAIDKFYDDKFGSLEYRTCKFKTEVLHESNFLGTSVLNITDVSKPYTRIIEHRNFMPEVYSDLDYSVLSYEYSHLAFNDDALMYPSLTDLYRQRYKEYVDYAKTVNPNMIFCGRIGGYKYTDMEDTIISAVSLAQKNICISD